MSERLVDKLLAVLDPDVYDRAYLRSCLGVLLTTLEDVRPARMDLLDHVFLDTLIAACDRRMGAQLDELLHSRLVQALEAAWRGLRFVVDRVDFAENIQVEIVSCSKEDLANDFADASEIPKSGLYRLVYTRGLATFGGQPYGLLCANYEFGPTNEDVALLRYCAAVAAMAHAPFVANASSSLFGLADFSGLPRIRDFPELFAGPRFRFWQAMRELEDVRYLGLCLPRFLLRTPYTVEASAGSKLRYGEVAEEHAHHLWGPASLAFAVRAADAFARFRWCVFLTGSRASGMIEGLPSHEYAAMPGLPRCPLECLMTSRVEHALSAQGFIGLVYDRASGNAMFHTAASVQRQMEFADTPEGQAAAVGEHLGTQLPYVFLVSRLAHYLKCVQREQIGQWDNRGTLQRDLERWLQQYVSAIDNPQLDVRTRRPLRKAAIQVETVEGQAGWYRCHLFLQPHLTHNNASFTLSLVGRLDKPADRR